MALYNSGTLIADVALTDTFNTWRTRFNQAIADAASTTANNTFTVKHTFNPPGGGPGNGITIQNGGSYNSSFDVTANTIGGTLTTAAQAGITSVGTLTALTIGQGVLATSGPVTAPIVTANTLGGTLSTAAQPNITSVGTLTALTVDNIGINGTTIGHTSDTDLMTLTSGVVTVAGELSATTLDIGGTNITATATEINQLDGVTAGTVSASKAVIVDGSKDLTGLNNVTIAGNLTVNGTTTTINSATLDVGDNIIALNADMTGSDAPTIDAGFRVDRGSSANVALLWDEGDDKWSVYDQTFHAAAFTGTTVATTGNITAPRMAANTADMVLTSSDTVAVNRASAQTNSKLDVNGAVVHPVNAVGASDIDVSLGGIYTKTAGGNLTWTFSNVAASRAVGFILKLTNGGNHTMTWPGTVDWPGGSAPSLTSSGTDILVFITHDGGTNWYGNLSMAGVA